MLRHPAPAKINLALHVTGQRSDGYHLLDSLVCFADVGDFVSVEPADELNLQITGPVAASVPDGPENLILKAAQLFGGDRGARLTLEKNLPVASGIGGGSADAAAALKLLCEHWHLPMPDQQTLLELGADLPVCLFGETVRMRGIGEKLERIPMPSFAAVLVNPGVHVATPEVFKALQSRKNPPLSAPPNSNEPADWLAYLKAQRNDLQAAACRIAPDIDTVLKVLANTKDCDLARMSGSGASCFGLFGDTEQAQAAARAIAAQHPTWWVKATHLGG